MNSIVIEYGKETAKKTLKCIDNLPNDIRERSKSFCLSNDEEYVKFISTVTNSSAAEVKKIIHEYSDEENFHGIFDDRLKVLNRLSDAGDLRLHSITMYLIVRLKKPKLVFETGVAAGKSTSLILLALRNNDLKDGLGGRLISFDIPPDGGLRQDGSSTNLHGMSIGWLIPDFLRDAWTLRIGDSLQNIPKAIIEYGYPDIFLHDSLHTELHTMSELNMIFTEQKHQVICADNLEMGSGQAFNRFCLSNKLCGCSYTNFGIAFNN